VDAEKLKVWLPKLRSVGGGALTLLFALSLLQGLWSSHRQSKMLKQQQAQQARQAMLGQVIPGYGLTPGQVGQGSLMNCGAGLGLGQQLRMLG